MSNSFRLMGDGVKMQTESDKMKIVKINWLILVSAVILVLACAWMYFSVSTDKTNVENNAKRVKAQLIQENRHRQIEKARKRRKGELQLRADTKRPKPRMIDLDLDEEAKLNEFSRKVLRELQDALDSQDFAVVSRLAQKMMEIPPDPMFGASGVDTLLRRKAVEALGWFGGQALPELVGMLADTDPEIVQTTFDQFTLALEDISLSDYERADIVVMASKVLTNTDDLEVLFMEINNMRHSVGADALVQICLEGTSESQSLMPDAIEFFTGEDNLETVEDVEKWLQENPDGEDDDDLYGGDKDI